MNKQMNAFFMTIGALLLSATLLPLSELAAADEPATPVPPTNRLYLDSLTVARYNPLGLITRNRLMYSRRLVDSGSVLLRDTFFAAGVGFRLTPSNFHGGPIIELQPLTIFHCRFGYEYVRYFVSFDNMQSFPTSEAHYADSHRKKAGKDPYATGGHHYYAEPSFQIKFGPVAAKTTFSLEYWDMGLRKKWNSRAADLRNINSYYNLYLGARRDKFFYEPTLDSLVLNESFMWTNDTNLVYSKDRLTVGARFSGVFTGYGNDQMRIGPIFAWSFNTKDYTSFNRPTLLVIVQWYVVHPSKLGPLPYVLLGFSFNTDFLKRPAN